MLHRLNERFRAEGRPELHFRAGLTRGPAVVGNMGSTQRFNYTAMGDTVNLASRLEGANKVFGTAVLLNDAAYRAASHRISARHLGKVRVVGRSAPAEVYELVGKREEASAELLERLEMFERALCLLQAGDIDAAEKLFGFLRTGGDAVLLDLCLAKCREVRQHGGGWDGVWVLGGK
jgi:adenylate cyclase